MSAGLVAAAVAIAVGLAALNAAYSAQHAIVDRDPGVYNTVGLLLAQEGTARIDPHQEYFAPPGSNLVHSDSLGFVYEGGRVKPQFANLLPMTLAVAHWFGGSFLLYKANALLSAFALLVFFAFAARLVDPRIALGAMTVLGVNPVFAWFARDAYSEILALTLVFGALWALIEARAGKSIPRHFVAGLLAGATLATRIDGALVVVGLSAFLCIEWLATKTRDRSGEEAREQAINVPGLGTRVRVAPGHYERLLIYATAAGALITAALAVLGVAVLSPPYMRSNVAALARAVDAVLLLVGLTAAVNLARGRLRRAGSWLSRNREPLARGLAAAVVVLGLYAFLVAPHVEMRTAGANATPTYGEETVEWLGWYAGAPTILLGIVGLGFLAYKAVRTRAPTALVPLLVFTPQTFYFWDAQITPDQLWVMRRFLPVVIPMAVVAAAVAVQQLLATRGVASRRVATAVAAAFLLAATLGPPLNQLRSLTARTQVPMRTETKRLCATVGPSAAVLVPGLDIEANHYAATVRATCRVPVVLGNGAETEAYYRRAAQTVSRVGRQLVVVSSGPLRTNRPRQKVIDARVDELERVIGRRPKAIQARRVVVWITRY